MSASRSPQERRWIAGGIVAAIAVAVLGWVLLVSPQRAETTSIKRQAADVRQTNLAWQAKLSTLRNESRDMTTVRSALQAAQRALPDTGGVPDFLRSLQVLGNRTGTDVVSLAVGAPVDMSTVAGGTPAAASTSPAPASSPTASAGVPAAGSLAGVYGLTITAQVNGPSARLDSFLRKLQTEQPRAVLITHMVRGSAEGGATSLQLTMQAFVAPSAAAERTQLSQAAGR